MWIEKKERKMKSWSVHLQIFKILKMLVPHGSCQDRKMHFGGGSIKIQEKIYRSFLHWPDDCYKLRSITLITKSTFL